MDEELKDFADTLYEKSRMESGRMLGGARADIASKIAVRNRGTLPLSGPEIREMLEAFDRHIERCMVARLDSYQAAFDHIFQAPTPGDFTEILNACEAVRVQEIRHSAAAVRQFIGSRGVTGLPGMNFQAMLESSSTAGHDSVLQKWKVWKAKVQLKPPPAKAQANVAEREKERDGLVSAYSKAQFALDLPSLISTSSATQPCALLFLDLDKFKSINDTLGHPAGDRALKEFADALLRACAGKGSVYRNGGDEFCVVLPNHSLDEAVAVAERILREVRLVKTEELPNGLSSSIGAACFPESSVDHVELLSQADGAMYVSKRAGGNRVSLANRR